MAIAIFCNDRVLFEIAISLIGNLDTLGQFLVHRSEIEAIHHQTRQQIRVARRLDLHFPQHTGNDDFAMLVINFHALATINALNLVQQVLLNGFLARDPQNIVRHQRTIDQRMTGSNDVARMHQEPFARRNQVLAFDAALALDGDRSLAAAFLA